MKILFLTDNFPPEVNAPATRTFEHCKEWVKLGADITVITGAPNFPKGKVYAGYKNKLYSKEIIDGIKVIRVWTYISENKGTIKRTLDYMSFGISALLAGLLQACDLIIGTSPQLFTALSAKRLAALKHKPWIMEVRDIWPESIKTVGAVRDGLIMKYFERKERQCYRSAKKIICVTQGIYTSLQSKGVPSDKLTIFTNGANLDLFSPREKDQGLVKELGLEGKMIIGYLGTLGMSHKLDFILKSAADISNPNIHIVIIGEGAEKDTLITLKNELNLKNVSLLNGVKKEDVPKYLSIFDMALVNLRKTELFLGALPSKIFENAAMGIPILLGLQGEAKEVIENYSAGIAFEPENSEDFIRKIDMFANDEVLRQNCKEACVKLAQAYDRKKIAKEMLEYMLNVK